MYIHPKWKQIAQEVGNGPEDMEAAASFAKAILDKSEREREITPLGELRKLSFEHEPPRLVWEAFQRHTSNNIVRDLLEKAEEIQKEATIDHEDRWQRLMRELSQQSRYTL